MKKKKMIRVVAKKYVFVGSRLTSIYKTREHQYKTLGMMDNTCTRRCVVGTIYYDVCMTDSTNNPVIVALQLTFLVVQH